METMPPGDIRLSGNDFSLAMFISPDDLEKLSSSGVFRPRSGGLMFETWEYDLRDLGPCSIFKCAIAAGFQTQDAIQLCKSSASLADACKEAELLALGAKRQRNGKQDPMTQHYRQFLKCAKLATAPHESSPVIQEWAPPANLIGFRFRGTVMDQPSYFTLVYSELKGALGGTAYSLYYDNVYKSYETEMEVGAMYPESKRLPRRRFHDIDLDIHHHDGGACLSIIHKGTFESISMSAALLLAEVERQGRKIILPLRTECIVGPTLFSPPSSPRYLSRIRAFID